MTGPVSFGPYTVLGVLGGGNYATVYRARMSGQPDEVALKVLAPDHARDAREQERFRAEYRLLARLRHPGIPRLLVADDGANTGRPFFVMTLSGGTNLRDRIDATRGLGLSVVETVAILRSLAHVVDYLHSAGVVHQDIKGENVVVNTSGGAQAAMLVDFGIAYGSHLAGLGLTNTGYGTVVHAAPEQASGNGITGAVDRYALGVLAYHMLAGELPGVGVTRTLPPLAAVRPGLPNDVYAAVSRALDPKPGLRHPTARSFVKLLARAAAEASPPVAWQATPSPLSSGSGMVQSNASPVPPIRTSAAAPLQRPVPPGASPLAPGQTGSLGGSAPPKRKSSWRWVLYGVLALSVLHPVGPVAGTVLGRHVGSHRVVVRLGPYVTQGINSPASRAQSVVPATQGLTLTADVLNCCSLSVTQIAPTADGGVRLLISFQPAPDHPWIPDTPLTAVYLTTNIDIGRLLTVEGTAAQQSDGAPTWGWYTFGHLGGDPSTLTLHYLSTTVPLPVAMQNTP